MTQKNSDVRPWWVRWVRGQQEKSSMRPDDGKIQERYKRTLPGVHTYPCPLHNFNPLVATDHQLAEFGLPERPDPAEEPDLFRFWERMLSPPFEFVVPEFQKELFAFRHGTETQRRVGAIRRFGHREHSLNWSGAYITPLRPNRFMHVCGMFTVPDTMLPSVVPAGANQKGEEFRSSTWIGLGGHRPYNSLPQIGTNQYVWMKDGRPVKEFGAWWQWWVDGRPDEYGFPIRITNFPVAPGHVILASLTVESPSDVHFHLKNQNTGKFVTFKVREPPNIMPLGSTAEWVHERPTRVRSSELYPLPSTTNNVEFSFCLAKSSPIIGGPETTQRLDNPRLVHMFEVFDTPHRTAFVSKPRRVRPGPPDLRIVYHEAGT
jgi:hypothetical protein